MAVAHKEKKVEQESWFVTDNNGQELCGTCDGTGLTASRRCKDCEGHGTLESSDEKHKVS